MSSELLTIKEAARVLTISPGYLRVWVADGLIGHVRVGPRCIRIKPSEIERFLAAAEIPAKEQSS
jgi:excisionase family DNA binding protein